MNGFRQLSSALAAAAVVAVLIPVVGPLITAVILIIAAIILLISELFAKAVEDAAARKEREASQNSRSPELRSTTYQSAICLIAGAVLLVSVIIGVRYRNGTDPDSNA